MKLQNIDIQIDEIRQFCHKWQIIEFALFGSVLRNDFTPESDIDILVNFDPNAQRGLSEMLQMQDELQIIFNRKVDLIVKDTLKYSKNWLRRKHILESAKIIYAA